MIPDVASAVAGGLVVVGLLVMTAAVIGMARVPDLGVRIHAASKAVGLGVIPILLAAMLEGDARMAGRAVLILVFLALTTTVGAHAIARAAWMRRRRRADASGRTESPPP